MAGSVLGGVASRFPGLSAPRVIYGHASWHTSSVPWLVSDARVLASADVASDRSARRNGLLGRDGFEGALVFDRAAGCTRSGMRFPIDVAYVDEEGVVVKTMRMGRHRIGVPVWNARVRDRGRGRRVRALGAARRRRRRAAGRRRVTVGGRRHADLVATPIGNLGDLSPRAVEVARERCAHLLRGHPPHGSAAPARRASGRIGSRSATSTPRRAGSPTCSRRSPAATTSRSSPTRGRPASPTPASDSCAPCSTPGFAVSAVPDRPRS